MIKKKWLFYFLVIAIISISAINQIAAISSKKFIEHVGGCWCRKGHLNLDQACMMYDLCVLINPGYIVETGFCTGRSSATILSACRPKRFISVDINLDYLKPEGRLFSEKLQRKYENYSVIEGESKKILNSEFFNKNFPYGIDWATINGGHDYETCYHDLNICYQVLTPNGLIIVDGYKSGPPHSYSMSSVTQAIDDFCQHHNDIRKIGWLQEGKGFAILTRSIDIENKILTSCIFRPIVRAKPWITQEANNFLEIFLTKNKDAKILEFGSGASTIWFAKKTKNLVSIEHNKFWFNRVKQQLTHDPACNSSAFYLIKRPYYKIVASFPSNYFDLILVDGRDRVECINASVRILKSGGILMLDNAERPRYGSVYNKLKNWKLIKTGQIGPDEFGFNYPGWQTNWWIKP